jgi:hypothetical protein
MATLFCRGSRRCSGASFCGWGLSDYLRERINLRHGPSSPNALREIRRVLAPEGQFYCTVPTKLFKENYLLARLLRRAGFSNLAGRYVDSMDRRCAHVIYHTTQDWIEALKESGFINIHVVGFFTPTHMTYWSILTWTPFRILSVLRIFPIGVVHQLATRLEQKLFSSVYRRIPDCWKPEECVYVLIHGSREALSLPLAFQKATEVT